MHWRHMETMSLPKRKISLKFCAVEAARHDHRDKLRKFRNADDVPAHDFHVDVSCAAFACKLED